ncbi:MFS transporter [Aerosakkonema funiforme]|uniref:MFS transporter n=1 Tax=Aerosakkonema funiforme TaxID=1246630 RepID=UPI0035B99651
MVAFSNLYSSTIKFVSEISSPSNEIVELVKGTETVEPNNIPVKFSKQAIRSSLSASTWDGVFAALFGNITSGVLLSNFLVQLGASSVEIGILSSIPMLVNFLQPVGAYLAGRSTSRRNYGMLIFGPSRLLWLILALGIWFVSRSEAHQHDLLRWTLATVVASNLLTALGSPSWLSWMATLVPERLRGRYFGIRNSAANLTKLISIPLLGLVVSAWPSGMIRGYGLLLLLGVVFGLISLGCQIFMVDINPQEQSAIEDRGNRGTLEQGSPAIGEEENSLTQNFRNPQPPVPSSESPIPHNFLIFLLFFGFWTFATNLSSPFFDFYLLNDLGMNVSLVTLYNSLSAGANLLMFIVWGKLADRIGNRPLLLLVGILVAVTPLFWLGTSNNSFCVWFWLPLLHLFTGGTWAAIDLCNNNIQMSIAPTRNQTNYFAIAAAVGGVAGAMATTAAGFLAHFANIGGLLGLFAISAVLRLMALVPLLFVREQRSQSLIQVMRSFKQFCLSPAFLRG